MLAILDYKAGNQTSVRRALDSLGIPCIITADADIIRKAHGVIFPGVGAAGQAMDTLSQSGLDTVLRDHVASGLPLLGICLGCQIILDYCEENDTKSLGIISGTCRMFDPKLVDETGTPIRVPHMGWNTIDVKKPTALLKDINPEASFYFVHSYYPDPAAEYIIANSYYGKEFCAIHGREGLWACQFHPEKSGRPGLQLLSNFYAYCLEAQNAQ